MWIIALLMFFSLLVAGGFLAAFIWAVRRGQYDDKYTPSVRILFDETPGSGNRADERKSAKKENLQEQKKESTSE